MDLTFDRQTLKNVVCGIAMTLDLVARAAIASATNWAVGGEEVGDDRDIGLIIKGNLADRSGLEVIEDDDNPYVGVVAPRYAQLTELLEKLTGDGIEIVEVAGQTRMQIDVVVDKENHSFGSERLYERLHVADPSKKIVVLDIPVKDLGTYFSRYAVHRIYDF
jgi:hypothetical protein